jgi:hypothetical protein
MTWSHPERRQRPRSNDRKAQRTLLLLTLLLVVVGALAA